ncbi:hypothetical protein LOK49_LG15G01554 [Camellia lanceoleosa]|uniref:Uncharacterized protein n=1 Tax=Camellia lanceoleosa TaxID=1840588 RepID=A0ACC0F4P1_9ERIC|nr:hypothetical protein LOK49_LG15G01554 [Camellia lanceoleosa]
MVESMEIVGIVNLSTADLDHGELAAMMVVLF